MMPKASSYSAQLIGALMETESDVINQKMTSSTTGNEKLETGSEKMEIDSEGFEKPEVKIQTEPEVKFEMKIENMKKIEKLFQNIDLV